MGTGSMTAVVETLDLLLRKSEENGHDIALIYPEAPPRSPAS
jgi:hypothetical protein